MTTNPIHTKRKGPFPCKGKIAYNASELNRKMTREQVAWMKEHKPLCFTGDLWFDLHHLPQHLRSR